MRQQIKHARKLENLLVKNGRIITSTSDFYGDVLIENGRINKVFSTGNQISAGQEIDAGGCYVLPGFIDPHVHLHLETPFGFSSDDFYTGSKAALHGGTTTLLDFVTPKKNESLTAALEKRKTEAADALIDYSLHVSPVSWNSNTRRQIISCVNQGISSFKVYLAYQKSIGISDYALAAIMETLAGTGAILMIHCENDGMISYLQKKFLTEGKTSPKNHGLSRPAEAESEAVNRAISFSEKFNCPVYLVHLSSAKSAGLVEKARKKGLQVYGETCPQYLLLDESSYDAKFDDAAKFVMSPPLRKAGDQSALWDAIASGAIQSIGTDHCPFTLGQKKNGKSDFTKIPNGAGGIEHRPSLMFTFGVLENRISMQQWVNILSTNPAKLFGLKNKGDIRPGMDADVVIWDADAKKTISARDHHQNCDQNIYEGITVKGLAKYVITNGRVAIKNQSLIEDNLSGRFIRCGSSGSIR